ncbi:cytochrome P450 [Patellaria atrata CBS 101060]|uniref:Cytochrome P450 n=1 Tax=Patellaria atrata CBS 101060 TaxID=1346257 RepID=A0A9P4VPC7_9PEZI|nr:cytochrome P450 [Patellaria atrata CBS 101060]
MVALDVDWFNILTETYSSLRDFGIARLLTIIIGVLLAFRLVHAFFLSPLRNVPGPLVARLTAKRGDLDNFSGRVAQNVQADYERYGDIYVYKPNAVCISHPDDIRAVLGSQSQEFRKAKFFDIFDDGGTPNIVSLREPELVSRRRRQIGPFFNYSYLDKMENIILSRGYEAMKAKWDKLVHDNDGQPTEVNYRIDTQLVTFDIMSALAFGREFNSIAKGSSSITKWTGTIMSLLDSPFVLGLLSLLPFSLVMRPWKYMYRDLAVYSKESIAQRKAVLASRSAKKPVDILQAFIDAEDPESKAKMTPPEVQAESIMMMLAGSETTSSAIMWSFHLLLLYPKILQRAVAEVRSVFPLEHLITYKEVRDHLPYVEACVYEALRQSPTTAGLTPRISYSRGISIQGHYIPPNTEIYVNLRSPNMHNSLWEDPNRFNPERFLNDTAKHALFTFSYGPRICIGRNLAWVEMLTIIANTLKDYDIALPENSLFNPENVDAQGLPKLLPCRCFIASFPENPDRDCRLLITKRTE